MKIAICGSLDFIPEMIKALDELINLSHKVLLPRSAEMVINGQTTIDKIKQGNATREGAEMKIKIDAIRAHYNKIRDCDAILVLNYTKNNTQNYIGGNTFLEMGFAHVLDKKIFLLNSVPDMLYSDEILAMQPITINGELNKIR